VSPQFTEDWFSEWSQEALADLCRRTRDLTGDIVEVGSWEGRSTLALAAAAHPQVVHAVDTWRGSTGEITELFAAERDVYSTFCANTEGLNIVPHRQDWRDYFTEQREPVKFCFIDGLHTYEEVRDQIDTILPLVVPDGIMCGDDVHHRPIQEAVIEQFPDANVIATLWWAKC